MHHYNVLHENWQVKLNGKKGVCTFTVYLYKLSNLSKYEESLEWFHHGIFIKRCSLSMHFSRQGPINLWILHRRKQATKAKLSWLGSTLWREKSQTLFQINQNVEGNQAWSNFFQPAIWRRLLKNIPILYINMSFFSSFGKYM